MSTYEPVYLGRPGADDIVGAGAPAEEVSPGIWLSPGLSNSFMLTTDAGRIVLNTGMGFEGPVHRANFDAVDAAPIRYIILTQGHVDHVGGIDSIADPGTDIVAQTSWETWRRDNELLAEFRARNSAFAWIDKVMATIERTTARFGSVPAQSVPIPTVTFDDELVIELGGRRLELYATPGGETTDSLVVWLPDEGVCLCGNVFGALFGHIPNLVTMRGDRYRDALTVVESIDRVRALGAETLLTGHFGPIVGKDRIEWELTRLRDAVSYIHDRTVEGMNAGKDVHTLMREVVLPADLEVGQGYGMVRWNVRAIWENYAGWFHHRSTAELYAEHPDRTEADLLELAGTATVLHRARTLLDAGEPVRALRLAEIVNQTDPANKEATDVLIAAHELLLESSTNFWETAWLHQQIAKLA
ncbi:MBL fold metallo-hydrolase [Mycolicibacterium diernhoferi]|uniref:MBL fold metallo-hydrolase n=1 Tax=Mycolicibacterium diernhoferi TaxID=1801 RepID=A0A1Q4H7K6_9MYCO|nr:MBL fold metallo-hydrolase [Mycolicibacterium diernhoferi]OJZ63422.1 MBL fold metallo-hydrolase [Mycolicibacterium diernhoferi]OPE54977.1 MBL fold metallo-hydrolase [Mycolicibacterium diernhoferi]PEG53998.1 MBL fold metallo-hydrolase [Mycolicibacterium diernhoferi]QYL20566.1 MBL fold metallo-hydrolase [Mycolicibacterium diernhoferi]